MNPNRKIKIGILCKEFDALRNFELRIIQHILDDSSLELKLLIFDGRKTRNSNIRIKKIIKLIKDKKLIAKGFLKLQEIIESSFFKIKNPCNKNKIIKELEKMDSIKISPKRKGFLDIFSENDSKIISSYNLDIIIRHEFNIIRGKILESAKYGIWSFHHGDNKVNRGGPACFWEILLRQKHIGVTLQKLTPELDGGYVIDKGFYNIHWSWIKSRITVQESSVSLLIKNLNLLKKNKVDFKEPSIYFYELYKDPRLFSTIKYLFIFYSKALFHLINKLKNKVFGIRKTCWALFFSRGLFSKSVLFRSKPIVPPKNEFWADPFIINNKNKMYVFFENYSYKLKKGKISCGVLNNNSIIDVKDALSKEYHLSYPFIFKEGNGFYMIPETSQNMRLEIYKCSSFPTKWELYSTAFEGEMILDCNYFVDDSNQKWLFLNKKTLNSDSCSDLYIYAVDSLKLNKIYPHSQNPVITDSNIARNAGPIYKAENKIFRPSQINNKGVYGRGLNINEILELNLDIYKEKNIVKCLPNFAKNIQGIHHLHQTEDLFISDLCYKSIK